MAYHKPGSGRLFLFSLSTGPHCRAARKILEELGAPFDLLEVDLLTGPERERALAELTARNPAQTFPTLLGGGPLAALGILSRPQDKTHCPQENRETHYENPA
jgi:glutaredoxin